MPCNQDRQWQSGEPSGIYFLGGIHAREWGSPDILINFVEQLCEAYRKQSGITRPRFIHRILR
jgi:hypothetical protein